MRLAEFNTLNKKEKENYVKQKIKDIEKAGEELSKLGIWSIPKKIKKGVEYSIWKTRE